MPTYGHMIVTESSMILDSLMLLSSETAGHL